MRLVQVFRKQTVVEAALERIAFLFDHFPEGKIVVAISGGKDSLVLAYLAMLEARRRGRRVALHFLDEEVVYEATVEMVAYLLEMFPETVVPLWLQVEFNLTNATSVTEGQLRAWEAGKHKEWMRPKRAGTIQHPPWDRDKQTVRNKEKGFGFYDAIANFERCYTGTAFLVGLRAAGESPNRWRAVVKHPVEIGGRRIYWGTQKGANVAVYPLYDWLFHDIWRFIWDARLRYHRIYDLQWKKGYPIHKMRVSSLIHEKSFAAICDLPEFEPKTYARLLKRIKGIAMAQETGKAAKLFRCSKLPKNFRSWIAYRDFLLQTHPDARHREIFAARFGKHLRNEYVARQQCRQLILGDAENNLPVDSKPDPRDALIDHYEKVL